MILLALSIPIVFIYGYDHNTDQGCIETSVEEEHAARTVADTLLQKRTSSRVKEWVDDEIDDPDEEKVATQHKPAKHATHERTVGDNLLQKRTTSRVKARVDEEIFDPDEEKVGTQHEPAMLFQVEAQQGTVETKTIDGRHVENPNFEQHLAHAAVGQVVAHKNRHWAAIRKSVLVIRSNAAIFAFIVSITLIWIIAVGYSFYSCRWIIARGAKKDIPILNSKTNSCAAKERTLGEPKAMAEMGETTDEIESVNSKIKECESNEQRQLLEWGSSESEPDAESEADSILPESSSPLCRPRSVEENEMNDPGTEYRNWHG